MESAKEMWQSALGTLQIQVSKANYTTWLSSSQGLSCQDNTFVVGVPNVFVAEWLSKRLYPLVRKTLVDITGKDIDVRFEIHNREQLSASPLATQTDGGTSSKATHLDLTQSIPLITLLSATLIVWLMLPL